MANRHPDGDASAYLRERRWFAAFKAASGVRAECEALLESMARIEAAWNDARTRLCEFEALRDALGAELETLDQGDDVGMRPSLTATNRDAHRDGCVRAIA
jgi:hypothetical protein